MNIKNLALVLLASGIIVHAADNKGLNRGMHEAPPKPAQPVPAPSAVSSKDGSCQSKPREIYNSRGVKQPGSHSDIVTPDYSHCNDSQ